jgi:hypothetical protein
LEKEREELIKPPGYCPLLQYARRNRSRLARTRVYGQHDYRGEPPRSDNNGGRSDRRLPEDVDRHKVDNKESIYKRVKMSLNKEYWRIWNFMQWFVKEQIEEETLAMPVLMNMRRWRASPV